MNTHTDMHVARTNQSSTSKWIFMCLGVAAVAFIAISVFKVSVSNVFFIGALLACPLMHVWMMKNGGHKH